MEINGKTWAQMAALAHRHGSIGVKRANEPVDGLGPARETAPKAPVQQPQKRSFVKQCLKIAAWTGLAVTVTAGSIGAIGWFGNPDLARKPEVTILADQNPASTQTGAAATAPKAAPSAKAPAAITVQSDRVVVVLPKTTVTGVATQAQQNQRAQKFLAQKAREAEQSLTSVLQGMKAPEGTVLLDAKLPLPTGDRAFFHLGPVDLPSFGVQSIQYRDLPLVVSYKTSPIAPAFKVGLETFQAQNAPRPAEAGPNALYLGSVRVSVSPKDGSIPVDGSLTLSVERDGKQTTKQLAELEHKLKLVPHDSPRGKQLQELIARHKERIAQGHDLPHVELLDEAFKNQTVNFSADVKSGAGAVAKATYHVWMGKDVTGDGRADLHLVGETDFSALDGLTVDLRKLEGSGVSPDGFLNKIAHDQVTDLFKGAIRQALPEATDSIRRGAIAEVGNELRRGTPWVADESNKILSQGYGQGMDIDVPPLAGTGGKHLHYNVNRVQVAPQGMVLEMQTGATRGQAEAVSVPFELQQGELALRIPGAELNQRLRDTIDWNSILGGIKKAQKLKELRFGQGGEPRFIMDKGKPAITLDVVARADGAILFDAKVATGIVVPLDFRVHEGKLEVKPDAKGVRMTDPQNPLPFNVIDLFPTRLLSNMIADFIADSKGSTVAAGLTQGLDLNFDKKGLQFVDVKAQPRGTGAPDLAVKLKATPKMTDFLLQQVLE